MRDGAQWRARLPGTVDANKTISLKFHRTMNGWRRFRAPRIAALALLPMCASAIAQTGEFAPPTLATTSAAMVSCTECGTRRQIAPLVALASPGIETCERSAIAPVVLSCSSPLQRMAALRELKFRDNQPLVNRLKRIQAVPLVTVWDSTAATLYVGVNRDGEPGLHLRQKKYDRGTLTPASRTLFSDVTQWRAIRLASRQRLP
jgi:hypothetical protein